MTGSARFPQTVVTSANEPTHAEQVDCMLLSHGQYKESERRVTISTLPSSCVYCCTMYVLLFFTLDAGLLARTQYSERPATGHLDTGFSRFPCAYKQMLRWFPRFQVATTCFSCSPPDLNLVVTIFCTLVK
jgi:hypothetical protein